tara:strand:+ start:2164 stop:5802 length:3639 start_codon:yes stop_codon:yes gene_type:complete
MVSVVCGENTNLSGGNAAGKSVFLKLIPFFYGAKPETLVDRAGHKSSFMDHYLPTEGSLIVFEYQRNDGPRCMMAYRGTSQSVIYRFVRASLDESFCLPDVTALLQSGVPIAQVVQALKALDVETTIQIDTVDKYCAIIQHDLSLLKNKGRADSTVRQIAREYCIGGADVRMQHIEKLTLAILKRNNMFSRLRQMIAESMFDGVLIGDKPVHIENRAMIDDVSSLNEFMRHEVSIRECIRASHARLDTIKELYATAQGLDQTIAESREKLESLNANIQNLDERESLAAEDFQKRIDTANDSLSAMKSEERELNDTIERYTKEFLQWDEITPGPEAMRQAYENLPNLREAYSSAKNHFSRLQSEVAELDSKRLLDREAAQKSAEKQKASMLRRKESLLSDFHLKKEQWLRTEGDIKERCTLAIDVARSKAQPKREQLIQKISEEKALNQNPGMTVGERLSLQEHENRVERYGDQIREVEEEFAALKIKQNEVKVDYLGRDKAVGDARRLLQQSQGDVVRIKSHLYPDDNTLLSQLRKADNWVTGPAKVIRPDLLAMKSLSPVLTEENNHFFGWELNLDDVNIPEFALSDAELKEKLRQAELFESNTREDLAAAEKRLADVEDRRKTLQREVEICEGKLRRAKSDLDSARAAKKSAERTVHDRIAETKASKDKEIKQLNDQLTNFNKALEENLSAIRESFAQEIREGQGHSGIVLSGVQEQINATDLQLQDVTDNLNRQLNDIEKAFSLQASEDGIDTEMISDARHRMEFLENEISTVEGCREQVRRYDSFMANHYAKIPQLEQRAGEVLREKEKVELELSTLKGERHQFFEAIRKEKQETLRVIKDLKHNLDDAESCYRTIGSSPVGEIVKGDLVFLTERARNLYEESQRARIKIIREVEKIRGVINQFDSSQIKTAWQQLVQNRLSQSQFTDLDPDFLLQQPQDLEILLDSQIPHIRQTLLQTVRSVGTGIANYYEGLKGLTRQVKQVSSRLDQSINTNQKIEDLEDISIKLVSRVTKEECWEPLSRFHELWTPWTSRRDEEFPPDDLIRALKLAIDTLNHAHIARGIETLIEMEISMVEKGRRVIVRTDNDLLNLSSQGLSYLAICVVFLGICRFLAPNSQVQITFPIDELATLSPENIARLFSMFEDHNVLMLGAFPSTDPTILKFFGLRYQIDSRIGVRSVAFQSGGAPVNMRSLFANAIVTSEPESVQ